MRLSISHKTTYHYVPPATRVIQVLRLTPRNHDGQYVASWRIDVSADCRLDQHEDAFGNITHAFAADGPAPRAFARWSRARSRRGTPMGWCATRSSGFRRACSCARRR